MPLLADRVKESTTTAGTSNLTLAGAPPGFRTFSGAFGNAASVYYVIAGATEWEIGIGTTGAGTLSRDTILASSAGGAKVNLSAGTKDVFCSYVADRAVTTSDAATLTNKTIDDYTNNVGANSTHFRIKAGATLAKGDVIKASGFTPGEQAIEVVKTASATDVAIGIVEQALSTGQFGTAVVIGELFDVNTNGLSVGATLYQNGAGGYTTTKPSSGLYQALGWVVRANTNNGVIAANVVAPLYVEASTNTANTSVLRDGSGDFAAGTITATFSGNLTGNVTGNVSGSSGSTTGNAATATALQTARNINGVSFNGTADITVTAAAGTLSGNTLASGVTASSLTSVGTLSSLTVSGDLTVDTSTLKVDSANNRVGIKQATPLHPLHVGTTDLILDTSGNLGLGVTPSAWSVLTPALQFGGGGAFIAAQTTTPALYTGMNAHFNGTSWVYKVDGTATYVLQFNGAHSWFTAASGLAGNTITFTERVRVDGTTTAGETALLLWDVDNGALERVTVGAADSGGVGYKVLRIPN